MTTENTEKVENVETTAVAETPKIAEKEGCEIDGKVVRTFEVPGDFVIEDIYTNPQDKNEKLINDVGQLLVETFGKQKETKKEKPAKILKTDDQIDLRLAQLGIDNNFKMCKDKDGKLSYRSHTFHIRCKTE
jgi:hypothetical protein